MLLVAVHAAACRFPVSFTQTTQLLAYSQEFTFCSNHRALRDDLIQRGFRIKLKYAPGPKEKERVRIQGSVQLHLSAVPGDLSSFTIEGQGWHRMYYPDDGKYLAAADHHLVDDGPLPISALQRGVLILRVRTLNKGLSIPERVPVDTSIDLYLKVFIKQIAKGVYSIDYEKKHLVGWPIDQHGSRDIVQVIGHMIFTSPNDGRNIIDLRRIESIATDYPQMMEGRLDPPLRSSTVPQAEWIPPEPCRESRGHS